MIKVKISPLEGNQNSFDIAIIDGEKLSDAVSRSLDGLVEKEKRTSDHFVVAVNGLVVPKDLWDYCTLKENSDKVLISPKIKGDDAGGLLRIFAIVATSLIVGPWAANLMSGAGIASGLITAAAVTLVGMLIPPPMPPGIEGPTGDLGSQMYTITGQQNSTRKFDTVPKVYGTHRVFPPFAASPYTELETDQTTGTLIQYFYAIYDLGLGPCVVEQLQIGDTSIKDYSDVEYRLVDLNKPLVSEGIWDDATNKEFALYKGDVNTSNVSVGMNTNESPTDPEDSYRIVRNASPNTLNYKQEISLNFVLPGGLWSFSSKGSLGSGTVDLDIEFSKIGEDNWFGWNDLTKVSSFRGIGGDAEYNKKSIDLYLNVIQNPATSGYSTLSSGWQYLGMNDGGSSDRGIVTNYGLLKGANQIVLKYPGSSLLGQILRIKGIECGAVIAEAAHSDPLYRIYTFTNPVPTNVILFTKLSGSFGTEYNTKYTDLTVVNKVTREGYTNGRARITRAEQNVVYADFKFTPIEAASYKIRVTRKASYFQYSSQTQGDMTWSTIVTRFDTVPIKTTKRHTFLEIRIRATDQLNGTIQNLSAVCSSVLDAWDGSAWVKTITNNPAWVFVDLLTGEINKRAIDKNRLDINSIVEWADFCDQVPTAPPSRTFSFPRFECNCVIDFNPTLQTAINMVTNASQASLNIVDGKYGVLIDKLRTTPVQIFTPRNSSGFGSSRTYVDKPHGLKISYLDPGANWEEREAVVYDTGFDELTATKFEEVNSFGCTNFEQAWRLGRYMLAQNRLRQETITIQVDFENLICTRGDYVQLVQDVMKVGGTPARVKSIAGNRVVIDEGLETTVGSYGFVFRAKTGVITQNTLAVVSADTFDLNGGILPEVGDLIVIGLVGQVVYDCIVKSIDPQDDLSATIILVEKADAIYSAESTDTLPNYSPEISTTSSIEFTPPGEVVDLVVSDNFYECEAGGPSLQYFITLDWDVPTNAAFELFEIYVNIGQGYNVVDTTKQSLYTYAVERNNLDVEHSFKVLAVSATGAKLQLAEVGSVLATPVSKTTPPPNVETFNSDITGEVLQLFWTPVTDCATKEYLIRYSPVTENGTWEKSIPLIRVDRNTNLCAVQARTGTYLIKAVDYEDNESSAATAVVTTIPNLFGLNIIAQTTDFPTLPGIRDRVVTDSGALTLDTEIVGGVDTQEYYSEGYYYYDSLLDLGEIYTVRLQSLIQAEGFTLEDLMVNWPTLSDLTTMSHAGNSDWDVETYYRTTDSFNAMADWTTLDSINPISEGSQDNWSAWRKFTIGDATGRVFEFRLKVISNKTSVTPRVFDGTIKADMPDRIESYSNLSAPSGGLAVAYTPGFKGPGTTPSVAISMESAQTGDYWSYDYKTLDGFYIRFFDKTGTPVARTFDAHVKGYGRKATEVI